VFFTEKYDFKNIIFTSHAI